MITKTGSKYIRRIFAVGTSPDSILVDVYRVLDAFVVTCNAKGQAIKKLLCGGLRNKGDEFNDTVEAIDACIEAALMIRAKALQNGTPMDAAMTLRLLVLANAAEAFEQIRMLSLKDTTDREAWYLFSHQAINAIVSDMGWEWSFRDDQLGEVKQVKES